MNTGFGTIKFWRAALLAACLLIIPWSSSAQKTERISPIIDSLEVQVVFPVREAQIQLDYMDNAERLQEFIRQLNEIRTTKDIRISRIDIVGCASPDGPYNLNQHLAIQRAENLSRYLTEHSFLPDSLITYHDRGIDWNGLAEAVMASDMAYRDEVLAIIENEPEITYESGTHHMLDSRRKRLMELEGGRPWRWMTDSIFPQLRNSTSLVYYTEYIANGGMPADDASGICDADTLVTCTQAASPEGLLNANPDGQQDAQQEARQEDCDTVRYPVMAFRSNLLVPLHNVGIEIPVARHWSLGLDWYYPWIWPAKSNKNCFELLALSAEVRYWFNASKGQALPKRNYLTGHSIGLYGAWGYYDFERNYKGLQGDGVNVGLDYLYSIPISKGKLRLEFELAFGAVWSFNAKPYNVYEYGGKLIGKRDTYRNISYYGPTKAGVSIVIPINKKVKPSANCKP